MRFCLDQNHMPFITYSVVLLFNRGVNPIISDEMTMQQLGDTCNYNYFNYNTFFGSNKGHIYRQMHMCKQRHSCQCEMDFDMTPTLPHC